MPDESYRSMPEETFVQQDLDDLANAMYQCHFTLEKLRFADNIADEIESFGRGSVSAALGGGSPASLADQAVGEVATVHRIIRGILCNEDMRKDVMVLERFRQYAVGAGNMADAVYRRFPGEFDQTPAADG